MAEKKSYTQVLIEVKEELSELKTITSYQENHLRNIDQHLNTQNERISANEKATAKNTDRIGIILRVGGWVAAILGGGGGITAITLKLLGVF